MISVAASSLALTLAVALQSAPQTPQNPPAAQLEDVVVEGRILREAVDRFVDDIVAPPVGRGPARWDRKVCVGVLNLRRDAAQVVVDQVSRIALDLGLEPGDPGCRPNILIIASSDGEAMARILVERSPHAFRPNYAGASRGASALDRFQASTSPVRWWHLSLPVTETGDIAVRMPGGGVPLVRQDGSRLTTRLRNDLRRAYVIIDLDRMDGVTFQQLGDYIGMVTMAQIDPEAETAAYDTVLNLFDAPGAVTGLTEWDRSYLSALYDAELNRRSPNHQGGEVAGLMFRDRQRAQPEGEEPPPAEPNPGP